MIKTALISVSDKANLLELARFLSSRNVKIISTGGTCKFLRENGLEITEISDYTGFEEIMDGRVKTLHPKVHGGLLMRPDDPKHTQQALKHRIGKIDLVVVNLYPFEETLKRQACQADLIENIDIGGPSMLRSAAKNFEFTTVLSNPKFYNDFCKDFEQNNGAITLEFRRKMAGETFAITAKYDGLISGWLNNNLTISADFVQDLRYGENPHQSAKLYKTSDFGLANATKIQGKELSYNNFLDLETALDIVSNFTQPAITIIKHSNPCGLAVCLENEPLSEVYNKAFEGDPTSAFGGIIGINTELDADTARLISKVFYEAIICKSISSEALEILRPKTNLRILTISNFFIPNSVIKHINGGILKQDYDKYEPSESDLTYPIITPKNIPITDFLTAFKFVKFFKSNAIVMVKNGQLISAGFGQTSRVDSMKIACEKLAVKGVNPADCVLASDAFFPFADNVDIAAKYGISNIIAPSGSIRDNEVIEAAKRHGITLIFTKTRHFKH
jgi:phosphoribosylaminoimidazolecarboxamide formyltransferase/IMP cyclohydrolase